MTTPTHAQLMELVRRWERFAALEQAYADEHGPDVGHTSIECAKVALSCAEDLRMLLGQPR